MPAAFFCHPESPRFLRGCGTCFLPPISRLHVGAALRRLPLPSAFLQCSAGFVARPPRRASALLFVASPTPSHPAHFAECVPPPREGHSPEWPSRPFQSARGATEVSPLRKRRDPEPPKLPAPEGRHFCPAPHPSPHLTPPHVIRRGFSTSPLSESAQLSSIEGFDSLVWRAGDLVFGLWKLFHPRAFVDQPLPRTAKQLRSVPNAPWRPHHTNPSASALPSCESLRSYSAAYFPRCPRQSSSRRSSSDLPEDFHPEIQRRF